MRREMETAASRFREEKQNAELNHRNELAELQATVAALRAQLDREKADA